MITEKEKVYPVTSDEGTGKKYTSQIIVPIVTQGDPIGSVVILPKDSRKILGEMEAKVAETAANFWRNKWSSNAEWESYIVHVL